MARMYFTMTAAAQITLPIIYGGEPPRIITRTLNAMEGVVKEKRTRAQSLTKTQFA